MNKKTAAEDRTVILSDDYVSESGVQGGKIIGEHLVVGSLLFGISFLIIGLYAVFSMVFGFGFPKYTANIIATLLLFFIGLLLIIGGYFIYRDKHIKN